MEKKKLKEIASVYYGKSPQGIKTNFSDIPIYGTGGRVGFSTIALFEVPLIVIARKGTLNNPIYSPKSCWIIDTAYGVIGKNGIDSKWLYFNFLNFNLSSLNEATGVPSINRNSLYNIEFFIPPLPEQQKIASILTTVDDKISSIEAQIQQTEQLKKGLMAKLLTEGIGHTEFKDTEIGRIPKGWEVVALEALSENGIKNGVFNDPKKVGKGYRLINVVNLYSEPSIKTDNLTKLDLDENELPKFKVQTGDIFFTRSSLKLEGIAHCNLYDGNDEDIVFECHIMMIRPKKTIAVSNYLRAFFVSPLARKFFMARAKQVTMTTIAQTDISDMPVPLPPLQEQQQIASILSSVDDKLDVLQSKKTRYSTLKKGLMAKLLTGKMRVKI